MRVLFCTDGSEISINALHNVAAYIKDATIDPICVIDWSFLPSSMNIEGVSYSKAYENIADSVLVFAESSIKDAGLTLGSKIKSFGSAVEGILEQIEVEDYDLILLGSHGKKGIQKWLGSVSRQIISNVAIPTFVSKRKTGHKKILFTVDGSEQAFNSVKTALKTLNLRDKDIYLVSVMENPELLPIDATLDKNWLDNIEKQQKIHAAKAINKAKSFLEHLAINVKGEHILTGNPAQMIIDLSRNEDIDLIIMGARTRNNLSKLLLGSVSKRVLENVTSDVLIISK